MLALGRYQARICRCGFHESLTADPANHFTFDVRVCPVCRGAAQFARTQDAADARHRKTHSRDNEAAPGPDPADGRRMFTRLLSPQEAATRRNSPVGGATRPPRQ